MIRLLVVGCLTLPLFAIGSCGKTPGSSDEPRDTGPGPDTSTDTSPDTDPVPRPPDFVVVSVDSETLAGQGYEIVTFELNPEAEDQYESLNNVEQPLDADGNPITYHPTFFVARPVGSNGESLTELFWFHGGTIADDRTFDETGEMPRGCVPGTQIGGFPKLMPMIMAAEEGWAMVLPRNDWCDYWTGLGPDDPVDPQRHFGYYHLNRILEFMATGSGGYMPSGKRYGWGTSAGGGAAMHIAYRHGALFEALVVDSSPSSMLHYHLADPDSVESFLGGAPYDKDGEPTSFLESYTQASSETLISDHNFRLPISMFWNSQDQLVSGFYPNSLSDALDTYYSPENVAWNVHDLNHKSPGAAYHTQSKTFSVPAGYVGFTAVSFLKGQQTRWLEAESGCSGVLKDVCTIGVVVRDGEDGVIGLEFFSGGAAMKSVGADGAGVLWAATLPSDLPRERPIRVVAVVQMDGVDSLADSTNLGRLSFQTESGEQSVVLTRSDFAPRDTPTTEEVLHQYRSTGIDIVIPAGEDTTLSWYSEGVGRTQLDAFIFIFDPEE
jgi:hypothetical protein